MNTDPTDTSHSHLDLEDLIARAAGQPVADRAKAHLAGCEHCQREANRWNLVADGVRILSGTAPEAAPPARPRRALTTAPWRRAVLAAGSAAAALALLVGVGEGAGIVHLSFGNGGTGSSGTGTTLAAVTGCSQLKQANGTLDQVNGSSLVIKTPSGQSVTVTTTSATFVAMSGVFTGDITDGASVTVHGSMSNETIEADVVIIGQQPSAANPSGLVTVHGTVADASTAGFTLVTSNGNRIPVSTSGHTLVEILHASLGQYPVGSTISALGQAEPNGTLSARAVAAVTKSPPGTNIHTHTSVTSVGSCSPQSIDMALTAFAEAPAN